jgi:hypothetical protein
MDHGRADVSMTRPADVAVFWITVPLGILALVLL